MRTVAAALWESFILLNWRGSREVVEMEEDDACLGEKKEKEACRIYIHTCSYTLN